MTIQKTNLYLPVYYLCLSYANIRCTYTETKTHTDKETNDLRIRQRPDFLDSTDFKPCNNSKKLFRNFKPYSHYRILVREVKKNLLLMDCKDVLSRTSIKFNSILSHTELSLHKSFFYYVNIINKYFHQLFEHHLLNSQNWQYAYTSCSFTFITLSSMASKSISIL